MLGIRRGSVGARGADSTRREDGNGDGRCACDTQYRGCERAAPRAVMAGLDFGTAFTKAVVGVGDDSYAVPLRRERSGIEAYLLPGLLRRTADGAYELAESKGEEGVLENLKLGLIERPRDPRAIAAAAGFLALVLQRVRLEFMQSQAEIYGRNRLDWHLNIGLPAESYDNRPLVDAFAAVAWAAWTLSVSTNRIDPARALVCAKDALSAPSAAARYASVADRLLHREQVQVVPEVVAETASYARSSLRNDGLHLLVDVGAGTLDVNAFNLFDHRGDDRHVLFLPKVQPLGSSFLARHRIERLRERGFALDRLAAHLGDEYGNWLLREELESRLGLYRGTVAALDGPFLDGVGRLLWEEVLLKVRNDYGRELHDWRQPVPTFLAGGGSADAAYRERIGKLSWDMQRNGQGGLALRALPMPDRFRHTGILDGHFHRLAVAYGLAQDPLNLGEFIPHGHLPPVARWRKKEDHWSDRYVSADQV